jgi:ADP-ribosylglycohydrolase
LAAQESVPAAFAVLALHPNDAWQACLTAASLGGDSDTIAAMITRWVSLGVVTRS